MTHPTHVPVEQFGEVVTRVQQLEQENARLRAKLDAKGKPNRSPVAALLTTWEGTRESDWTIPDLRAAIKAQADDWRNDTYSNCMPYHDGYCAALRRCADDLEGVTGAVPVR